MKHCTAARACQVVGFALLASVSVGRPFPTRSPARISSSQGREQLQTSNPEMREEAQEDEGADEMNIIKCALVLAIAGGPAQVRVRQATLAHSACRHWLPTLSTMPAWQSCGLCERGRKRQGEQTRDALTASQAGLYTHECLRIDC